MSLPVRSVVVPLRDVVGVNDWWLGYSPDWLQEKNGHRPKSTQFVVAGVPGSPDVTVTVFLTPAGRRFPLVFRSLSDEVSIMRFLS